MAVAKIFPIRSRPAANTTRWGTRLPATPVVGGQPSFSQLVQKVQGTTPWSSTAQPRLALPTISTLRSSPAPATPKPAPASSSRALPLAQYPRPAGDNGRGMHWIPTLSSTPEAVDRFVGELAAMHTKWVTFLNEGTNIGANDYLVQKLKGAGIMPVMRIYTHQGEAISGDIGALVRHYKKLGVQYFQLYNEPNLALENEGKPPSVERYLDRWIPAAKEVIAAGGLPGFGALSPGGEYDDRQFLAEALDGLKARGEEKLLDRAWLSLHNYTGNLPLNHPDGFALFRAYDHMVKEKLGRSLPIISTEGGTQVSEAVSEQDQVEMVTQAFRYMREKREPYYLAYTYWVVANEAGGGHDAAFSQHALFYPGGERPLVAALKNLA